MSEPQLPNPSDQPDESISPDPLLKSGSFIDADRNDAVEESGEQQQPDEQSPNVEFPPGTVIAAQPISMVLPGECTPEAAAPRSVRRRDPEEMSKKPTWLPEDWTIDLKVRTSGATAGLIDRYYVEPSEQKRRFRSKNEVLHFLETGNKLKRKPNSEADVEPSASPGSRKQRKSSGKGKKSEVLSSDSQKQKKSSGKGKKSEVLSSDSVLQPTPLNSVPADTPQEI
ncbi:hypothetical protein BUALT_Bualt13G0056100 [Buddleja alternifolia]|uniref:MBD domain-containing protein n=1 Tax=Buddleja alternifolia TaxID=168488 RepID=A0AAV6WKQ2_9LAMI|nr:hypothetical protein BUALT_Bualt13G0056100 [Buddleja alternifolia]